MLGCAVAGMGICLVPRIVLKTFPAIEHLSIHGLPAGVNRAQTVLIWRKGARSPKVTALLDILTGRARAAESETEKRPAARRKPNGQGRRAAA
jgi:DNA-binding transcriptional LysR family regulator